MEILKRCPKCHSTRQGSKVVKCFSCGKIVGCTGYYRFSENPFLALFGALKGCHSNHCSCANQHQTYNYMGDKYDAGSGDTDWREYAEICPY